jgi:hypothetical protein
MAVLTCLTLTCACGAVASSGCGGGSGPSVNAEITTPKGTFEITEVEFADKFPPDCSPTTNPCRTPVEGSRIVVVSLKSTEEVERSSPFWAFGLADKAYVVNPAGTRGGPFGESIDSSTAFSVAFGIKEPADTFQLFWPDNPPVELRP